MIDNKQLVEQIAMAMDKNPGRCVLDIIKDACEYKYPTRTDKTFNHITNSDSTENWTLTNSDIYKSLVIYNAKK